MHVIGITGSLATGKTTVLGLFKKKQADVLDADDIAHRCLVDDECKELIVRAMGADVLNEGVIDRKLLADKVFGDPLLLRKLEEIIHPVVREEIDATIKQLRVEGKTKVLAIEVPLLFEAGMDDLVDTTLVVTADQETQMKRAVNEPGITEDEARKRIEAQMPLNEKIRLADFTIDNSNDLSHTIKQVDEIWQKLL